MAPIVQQPVALRTSALEAGEKQNPESSPETCSTNHRSFQAVLRLPRFSK